MTEYHYRHAKSLNPIYPVDSLHIIVFDDFSAKVAFFSELSKNIGCFFIMMIVRCIRLSSKHKNTIKIRIKILISAYMPTCLHDIIVNGCISVEKPLL